MMASARQTPETDWPATTLRRIDPSRNMSRFWAVRLQPSLFTEVLLVRHWGRIGSRGQERSYWFPTRQAALSAFEKITAAKRRRGYSDAADFVRLSSPARQASLQPRRGGSAEGMTASCVEHAVGP